jgi:hypothetical protein
MENNYAKFSVKISGRSSRKQYFAALHKYNRNFSALAYPIIYHSPDKFGFDNFRKHLRIMHTFLREGFDFVSWKI